MIVSSSPVESKLELQAPAPGVQSFGLWLQTIWPIEKQKPL